MDNSSRKAWERLPGESDKAFNAFCEFLKMPIRDLEDPDNNRTLHNLSRKLGYSVADGKASSSVELWSSKFDWIERARKYDNHTAQVEITIRDASLEQYQQDMIERRTLQTALLNQALETQVKDVLERQSSGHPVDALEVLRLANAATKLDDLERRIAGLPTTYTSERIEEPDLQAKKFIIGG